MRKLVDLLGAVRLAVSLVTLGSVAVALHTAGISPLLNLCATGLLALALVKAPFGAKYRRW